MLSNFDIVSTFDSMKNKPGVYKMKKKFLSLFMALVIMSVSITSVFADSNNYVDGGFEKLPEISDEDIERGIEQALQMKLAETDNIDERNALEEGIREVLQEVELTEIKIDTDIYLKNPGVETYGLGDIWKGAVPNIHIQNKYVAATIDTFITGVAIALGAGTISAALKKYGAKQCRDLFTSTLKKRVIGKAAIAIGISIPTLATFIENITDPSGKMARHLDSKDARPRNGYLDVIW